LECKKASVIGRIWYHLYDKEGNKGSAIVDHLANNYVKDYEPLNFYLPDEEVLAIKNDGGMDDWWTMYFDGVVNVLGNGDKAVSLEKK